jgi:hypothetical protein
MSDLIMFERAISYKSSGKTYQVAISEAILWGKNQKQES